MTEKIPGRHYTKEEKVRGLIALEKDLKKAKERLEQARKTSDEMLKERIDKLKKERVPITKQAIAAEKAVIRLSVMGTARPEKEVKFWK